MKKGVKAVIFDVGGVLALGGGNSQKIKWHYTKGVHSFLADYFKINIDQWFDSIDTVYAKSIEGKISEKETLSIMAKNLKVPLKKLKRIFIKTYKRNFKQNKPLYKFAFSLKKKGYKIAILSDQWHISRRALIKKKYMKRFDKVIISCDVGMRKPSIKIYKFILQKLSLPPHSTVFIDNREWNLKPAKKLGMKTILFKNNRQLIQELSKLGVK